MSNATVSGHCKRLHFGDKKICRLKKMEVLWRELTKKKST